MSPWNQLFQDIMNDVETASILTINWSIYSIKYYIGGDWKSLPW